MTNFLTRIISDAKSWGSKIESMFKKVLSNAPTWTRIAQTTLTFLGPLLETVVTAEAGPIAGAALTAALTKIQNDLTAANALVSAVGPSPTLATFLSGLQSDLATLEKDFNITNPASISTINLIVSELEGLISSMPSSTATTAQPAKAVADVEAVRNTVEVQQESKPTLEPVPEITKEAAEDQSNLARVGLGGNKAL